MVAESCHTYFLLKLADLLDTVFFVLRKKQNQISFLHLYHHTGMVMLTWNATKFYPGGHSVFTGFLNSIIHVVMYGYYLVSAFNPEYKNNIWWKKYITQMQIVSWIVSLLSLNKFCDTTRDARHKRGRSEIENKNLIYAAIKEQTKKRINGKKEKKSNRKLKWEWISRKKSQESRDDAMIKSAKQQLRFMLKAQSSIYSFFNLFKWLCR